MLNTKASGHSGSMLAQVMQPDGTLAAVTTPTPTGQHIKYPLKLHISLCDSLSVV